MVLQKRSVLPQKGQTPLYYHRGVSPYERTSGTTTIRSVVLPSGEIRGVMIPTQVHGAATSNGTVAVCG